MGAPAARLLAAGGMRVALIASPEPTGQAKDGEPFGAHYDVSRLTWLSHTDPIETELSVRSQRAMAALDASEGGIFSGTGSLFVAAPGRDEGRIESARALGIEILDASQLQEAFPLMQFPSDVHGFRDVSAPGIMNPRAVVAAEQRAAVAAGATMFSTHATQVVNESGMAVHMADGRVCTARRVLVAAGAFSNQAGLLPRPLALRMKQETVLLARLTDEAAARLSVYPSTVYQLASTEISDVYSCPPLRYPDGSMCLKWGCNTLEDRWLHSIDEITDWYRGGDSDSVGEIIRPYMEAFIPAMEASGWVTNRCAVTYTAHGKPYIDEVEDKIYVAVGGNGHSAKWSPVLGSMAAELILDGAWNEAIPRDPFRAVFEGEESGWDIRDLWKDRMGPL